MTVGCKACDGTGESPARGVACPTCGGTGDKPANAAVIDLARAVDTLIGPAIDALRIRNRDRITIGPIAGERYAHVKINSDDWHAVEGYEVLLCNARDALVEVRKILKARPA